MVIKGHEEEIVVLEHTAQVVAIVRPCESMAVDATFCILFFETKIAVVARAPVVAIISVAVAIVVPALTVTSKTAHNCG